MPIVVQHSPKSSVIVNAAYSAGAADAARKNSALALQWQEMTSGNALRQAQLGLQAQGQAQDYAIKQQQMAQSAQEAQQAMSMRAADSQRQQQTDFMRMGMGYAQQQMQQAGYDRKNQMEMEAAKAHDEARMRMQADKLTQQQQAEMDEYNRKEQSLKKYMVAQDWDLSSPQAQQFYAKGMMQINGLRTDLLTKAGPYPWSQQEQTVQQRWEQERVPITDENGKPIPGQFAVPNPNGGWTHINARVEKPAAPDTSQTLEAQETFITAQVKARRDEWKDGVDAGIIDKAVTPMPTRASVEAEFEAKRKKIAEQQAMSPEQKQAWADEQWAAHEQNMTGLDGLGQVEAQPDPQQAAPEQQAAQAVQIPVEIRESMKTMKPERALPLSALYQKHANNPKKLAAVMVLIELSRTTTGINNLDKEAYAKYVAAMQELSSK